MQKSARVALAGALFVALLSTSAAAQNVIVTVPAEPGPVDGTSENSDAFIWRLLTEFAAPVVAGQRSPVQFETWASDADTFAVDPQWPDAARPKMFQSSVLQLATEPHASLKETASGRIATAIDVPCKTPGNAAVGGFPRTGSPTPCIAEETKRNRPQFDYIVKNQLNTQKGLAAAYAKSFKVDMPLDAVSVKGDWVPVETMLQWIPALGSATDVEKIYYTTVSDGVAYALVSLHVSSRQNTNWVWGTFEHQMNPGRCDYIGCSDTFGATKPVVKPDFSAYNTQYGDCAKTPALEALMKKADLDPVWMNYCMKGTVVDFAAKDGTPYALGNSVIEGITGGGAIAASSCISCHYYASFGKDGAPTASATAMLPYNPTGNPIPGVLDGALQFDFMWGVLLAPAGN